MAKETLCYIRVLLAGDFHRNHLKVPHVVAGRCLMALRARLRGRGGVPKFGDSPLLRRVTLGAVGPKQTEVFVFRAVACRAAQQRFLSSSVVSRPRRGGSFFKPALDFCHVGLRWGRGAL